VVKSERVENDDGKLVDLMAVLRNSLKGGDASREERATAHLRGHDAVPRGPAPNAGRARAAADVAPRDGRIEVAQTGHAGLPYWSDPMSKRMVAVEAPPEEMWTLSDDRKEVRMNVPPIPVAGVSEPLRVQLNFNAETIDLILNRLSRLRTQMLPPPQRH
jgi:hypothetical protein